jgi:hypothetical protein
MALSRSQVQRSLSQHVHLFHKELSVVIACEARAALLAVEVAASLSSSQILLEGDSKEVEKPVSW